MSPQLSAPPSLAHDHSHCNWNAHRDRGPLRSINNVDPNVTSVANCFERTPLLLQSPPIRCPHEHLNESAFHPPSEPKEKILSYRNMCRGELGILPRYALPVLAYVSLYPPDVFLTTFFSTRIFEYYSFSFVSVIVIGHLSTVYLAAAILGMMAASVTRYSIVQGTTTALDTLLPPAWTSDTPYMAGLWTQRMGMAFPPAGAHSRE